MTSRKSTGKVEDPPLEDSRRVWRGAEWKVVLGMVLLLAVFEWGACLVETRLSKDVAHLRTLPAAAKRLKAASDSGSTLLIVGNSLARNGIDTKLVGARYSHVEYFYPDGSSIAQWSWGVPKYFLKNATLPDEIWFLTARNHLLDLPAPPEKLGAFFVADADLPAALATMQSHEAGVRLLLGRASCLFANRTRVRPYVGYGYFPGFEAAWHELAAQTTEAQAEQWRQTTGSTETVQALTRLLNDLDAEEGELRIKIIAVPMLEAYDLPDEVQKTLTVREIPMVDFSETDGIDSRHFPDGYHLNSEGATRFTEKLLQALQ